MGAHRPIVPFYWRFSRAFSGIGSLAFFCLGVLGIFGFIPSVPFILFWLPSLAAFGHFLSVSLKIFAWQRDYASENLKEKDA